PGPPPRRRGGPRQIRSGGGAPTRWGASLCAPFPLPPRTRGTAVETGRPSRPIYSVAPAAEPGPHLCPAGARRAVEPAGGRARVGGRMDTGSPLGADPVAIGREVDALCDRFEDALKRGERPELIDWLPPGGPARDAALGELVYLELVYRLRAGEAVRAEDYF